MRPTVFLGLVTHARTRFTASAGPEGLVAQLSRALESLGTTTAVRIHDEDLHDADVVPLTRAEVISSIDAELRLESAWRAYVSGGGERLTRATVMPVRRLYRRLRLAPPWARATSATPPGAAMLRRLVNIELAHLALLREARESGAEWVLIAEDDAVLEEPAVFAAALTRFMAHQGVTQQPAYVNVSRSFDHATLGMTDHLAAVGEWSPGIRELSADRPLTNTVCAVLYRGAFLEALLPALGQIPVSPVLPIDWKLNAALLALHRAGSLGPGDCWFLDPAPIVQGSMHVDAG